MKLSIRHIKYISKRAEKDTKAIIKQMREVAKKDPKLKKKFKEYGVDINDIDNVHIEFCPLEVSAKTKHMRIYLNDKMLDKMEFKEICSYAIHELIHYLQQKTHNVHKNDMNKDYLDLETEEEAFKTQIDFKKRNEGKEEAEEYTNDLLDHHDYKGQKRKEKKKELIGHNK